jgi:hypothetical protein
MQYVLSMLYSFVHLKLYRPFLHYMASSSDDQPTNRDLSAYAVRCIGACQEIVYLNKELLDTELAPVADWTSTHMMLSAVLTLLYVVLDSQPDAQAERISRDLAMGLKVVDIHARYSFAANRCKTVLTVRISNTTVIWVLIIFRS